MDKGQQALRAHESLWPTVRTNIAVKLIKRRSRIKRYKQGYYSECCIIAKSLELQTFNDPSAYLIY